MRNVVLVCSAVLTPVTPVCAGDTVEKVRYLRPAAKDFEAECEFLYEQVKDKVHIESTTYRGKNRMMVLASYDKKGNLKAAETTLTGDAKKSATVIVAGGKAKVLRDGLPDQEFEVPKGVIVTSAPDWADTWLVCRRFDRAKGGKQTFPGLWIHPTMPSQRIDFTIEKIGTAEMEHAGKKQTLDRFTITLRNMSRYSAWADAKGQMILLVPMTKDAKAKNWIVREGYEKSTGKLVP